MFHTQTSGETHQITWHIKNIYSFLPGSSVGIATGYRLDGPGIEFSAPVQTGPGAHPVSCIMGTGSFLGGKEQSGRDADHSPPSSAVIKKG